MNKKIAMISVHACPLVSTEGGEAGGINIYLLELGKELANRGYKIDVFTRLQDTKQQEIVDAQKNLRVIHLKAGPKKHIPIKKLMPYISEFSSNFIEFINKEKIKYDLIHSHYYLSGFSAYPFAQANKIPHVITFHTLALMKNLVARGANERENEERIKIEKLLINKSNLVVAASESDKEYLLYLYDCPSEKIRVITPGVNTNLFKLIEKNAAKKFIGANPNHRIILFVGRIEPLKGIDVLMYALKIMFAKNKSLGNVCLWIVGGEAPSEERKRLETLRIDLGLETSVQFIGQKNHNQLPYYLNSAEVVVIPSHYESFGMSALEAMACGVPIIATNVSGISSLLDKKFQKLITSSNNPIMLSRQIEHLLLDEKEQERISKEVLTHVQDFKWEIIAKKISSEYQNLLK